MLDIDTVAADPEWAATVVLDTVPHLTDRAVRETNLINDLMSRHLLGMEDAYRLLLSATADTRVLRLFVDERCHLRHVTAANAWGRGQPVGMDTLDTLGYPDAVAQRMRVSKQATMTCNPFDSVPPQTRWVTSRVAVDLAAQPLIEHLATRDTVRGLIERHQAELDAVAAAHGPDLDTLGAVLAAADLPRTALGLMAGDTTKAMPARVFIDVRGDEITRLTAELRRRGLPVDPDTRPRRRAVSGPFADELAALDTLLDLADALTDDTLIYGPADPSHPDDVPQVLLYLTGEQITRLAAALRGLNPTDDERGRAFWTEADPEDPRAREDRHALAAAYGPALDALAALLLHAGVPARALAVHPELDQPTPLPARVVLTLDGEQITRLASVLADQGGYETVARELWTKAISPR